MNIFDEVDNNAVVYCQKCLSNCCVMKSEIKALLKQSDIPKALWPRVAADLAVVLKVAKETNGTSSAIKPASIMPKCGLDDDGKARKRAANRINKAAYRKRLRAAAIA